MAARCQRGFPAVGARVVVYPVVVCGHCIACLSDDPEGCRNARVFSETPLAGTMAEFVEVPVQNLVPLPDGVDFPEAACLPTAYLTAYHMLFTRAALRPGETALVQGASGGVATAAIILGRLGGLTVFATSRDAAKRQLALDLGAEAVFAPERSDGPGVDRGDGRRGWTRCSRRSASPPGT